jgi:hypothetical protein
MFRKRLIIIPKLEIRLATLGMRFLPRKLGLVLLSRQQHKKTS